MAQITAPELVALAEPGETVWESSGDAFLVLQRPCPHCDRGLLLCPARFCGWCQGSGLTTRRIARPNDVEA